MSFADVARGAAPTRSCPLRGGPRDASGFSVVELLVALSILIITLIALLSLATTSNFMVASSRQRSAMVNEAASYLDRVRQETYANVGVAGGDPSGTLASQVTTVPPYVITITPSVTWGRPEDPSSRLLKTVTLTVTSRGMAGGSEMSFTASALVADIGIVGLPTGSSGVLTPTCVVASPADGTVVWGTVSVTASATINGAGRTLLWMDMLDGVQSWGSTVLSGTSGSHAWTWNSTSAREGNHSIRARATDSSNSVGNSAPVVLTVDNVAPTVPGSLSGSFPTDADANVWWSASTDGTDVDGLTALPASHYLLWAYKQPTNSALASNYTQWTQVTGLNPLSRTGAPTSGAPLGISGLAPFSRYAMAVSSSSPDRGTSSGMVSNPTVMVGATRFRPSGTWAVAKPGKYNVTVTLSVPSGPSYPWSGTATTRFYRLTSAGQAPASGTLIGTVSSAYPTWSAASVTDSQSNVSTPTRYWYAAVTTLTPTGYGSASITVNSAVYAAPTDITTVGTRALEFAQW